MSADISLFDLVNLSIGTPEVGAVNFNALHTLLHAILGHLKIQNVTTGWREEDTTPQESHDVPLTKSSNPYRHVEHKLRQIESQLAALEKLPTGMDLLSRTASTTTPVNDMWQLMQLRCKSQANEDGVSKAMGLIQDLLKEIQDLKESRDSLKKEVKSLENQLDQLNMTELVDRIDAVEQCCHRVEDLDTATKRLQSRIGQYPDPENLSQCVTWEIMQTALVSERQKLQKEIGESDPTAGPTSGVVSNAPHFSASADANAGASPVVPGPGAAGQRAGSLPQQSLSDGALTSGGKPLSRVSSGAERYPETVEALREVGRLRERHDMLKVRVDELEASKADRTQLQHLRENLADMGDRDMPENLTAQLHHLRGLVDSLMGDRVKSSELMSDVQGAVLQLQAECEKLHGTANHLMEEHSQKQTDIDHLYKSMEKLDEKKADRELVEMEIEIKADKRALETKVSRMQFDTATEQLNSMFQELLGKIIDQEQDWHKVIEKISTEMECKLNRIELDPLKNQLEGRWNNIRKQLQAQPAPKEDDAAGIRMQLVKRFKCISCDRPVDMLTPGPHLLTVPSAPGLPSHKSLRPYTTYELEQVRQHCRSERIPEMVDYSYLALSRSCGGSHTMTYPTRRYARLQHISHYSQAEEDHIAPSTLKHVQPEEVGILGFDGHIYKGRLNTRSVKTVEARLPNVSSKDALYKNKEKVMRSQSQKSGCFEPGRDSPMRPQSAKTQRSRTASGSSVRDRPVSSLGCLSQATLPRSSSHADTPGELQQRKVAPELHVDLSQSEEEPVTNL
ncbi:uncharacterized protein C16orf96 isoform X2 [Esox lucius]|uniref:DUF4795 domain-containing protein n=1 Tax=Esox lucius TaxID=8010 RepID=A0AAY5KBT7_ESOLU|nr:uncharacterized protein C16orf96 isoform X2 [Esox lucius]